MASVCKCPAGTLHVIIWIKSYALDKQTQANLFLILTEKDSLWQHSVWQLFELNSLHIHLTSVPVLL